MQPQLAIAAVPYSPAHKPNPAQRLRALAVSEPWVSALRFPDRDGWQVLDWRDLQRVSEALGDQLIQFGFVDGDRLLLTGDLSANAIALTLAAWSIGGTVEVVTLTEATFVFRRNDGGVVRCFAYAGGLTALRHWLQLANKNSAALANAGSVTLIADGPIPASDASQGLSVQSLLPLATLLRRLSENPTAPISTTSRPAASYWLEECGNDLRKLPSLIDFWLATKAALSLPASAANPLGGAKALAHRPNARQFRLLRPRSDGD
jgi:hypothetical protein